MAKIMAEYVDRLINIEMRQMGGLPRGVTHALYEAARKFHKEPLTYLAASGLIEAVKPKDHVIIATGAGVAPWLPKGKPTGLWARRPWREPLIWAWEASPYWSAKRDACRR